MSTACIEPPVAPRRGGEGNNRRRIDEEHGIGAEQPRLWLGAVQPHGDEE